jgi:23S rRNA pseudoU1915 N3-methylase RlmH
LNCLNTSRKAKKEFVNYLKSKNITEITTEGIKIGNVDLNYLDEINSIFSQLGKNTESVILLLDELPEVLHRLHKNGKKDEAIAILNQLRTWRQSGFKKLQFVFAGSIGIHYVVKAIEGRTAGLNDLKKVICYPLIEKEPHDYIEWATSGATIQYSETLKSYLLQKIQYYYTPYFINLMLDEIHRRAKKRGIASINEQDINDAFLNVEKSNEHFADWKSRLKDYMPKADFEFVNEILIHIAHKDSISIQTIYDKSVKHEMPDGYMDLMI